MYCLLHPRMLIWAHGGACGGFVAMQTALLHGCCAAMQALHAAGLHVFS